MSEIIDKNSIVGDIVVQHPQIRNVFESFGIDYCCGGGNKLGDAVNEAGVDLSELVNAIQLSLDIGISADQTIERSWEDASLTELINHIESKHHSYTKEALPYIGNLFTKVINAHGKNHGNLLKPLHQVFMGLRAELEPHLMKEEEVLFPYILEMDAAVSETGIAPPMHCGTVKNPINQMKMEHENAGIQLAKMRSISHDFTIPDNVCMSFSALFEKLQQFETDLHIHIHLENNILFPRAVKMEEENREDD